ncbi:MAG: polysaccharide deacetylase family protein [Erysipelotrichaceae bacterium]|nr:polysaccharide deacetylase family protein [Erysipelotrichaceae bacterium]
MEGKTGKPEKYYGTLVSLFVCVMTVIILINNGNNCAFSNVELNKALFELQNEVDGIRAQYEEIDNKYLEAQKRLEEYEDINSNLEKVRSEFFEEASVLENMVLNGKTDKKIAYLTFDDGPYLKSMQFLDVLEEYDVPATFFYLMKCTETGYTEENDAYDAIYRRIIESGHTLGNHTATHKLGKNSVYSTVEGFVADIERNREFIYNRYGYTTDVMRFPGGSDTSYKIPVIIPILVEMGYGYVDWNCETGDGMRVLSAEEYRDNVLNNLEGKNIVVVLMHDYSANTLVALPEIIEGMAEKGYVFLPLFNGSVMCKKE